MSEVSVGQAVKELELKQLIKKEKVNKRLHYKLSISFLGYLEVIPKVTLGDTQSSLGNIPQGALYNNILKEKENTFFNNSLSEEDECPTTEEEFAKVFIAAWENSPILKSKAKELRDRFGL